MKNVISLNRLDLVDFLENKFPHIYNGTASNLVTVTDSIYNFLVLNSNYDFEDIILKKYSVLSSCIEWDYCDK